MPDPIRDVPAGDPARHLSLADGYAIYCFLFKQVLRPYTGMHTAYYDLCFGKCLL